ncbi:MAG: lysophospholipid acyltransferase family protein, partial [Chloroflexota bacterium]|nr:lysophospholipid acyltransferase family protein [Chloroflexota bacterium]
GAFPVRRGEPDRRALRQAEAVLREGLALGMFPEGTRSRTAQLQRPKAGTSLIALGAGAPILPVGISGSEAISGLGFIFRRPKITVNVGRSFTLPRREGKVTAAQLDRLSDVIMEHIADLLPESYRGVYGRSKDG